MYGKWSYKRFVKNGFRKNSNYFYWLFLMNFKNTRDFLIFILPPYYTHTHTHSHTKRYQYWLSYEKRCCHRKPEHFCYVPNCWWQTKIIIKKYYLNKTIIKISYFFYEKTHTQQKMKITWPISRINTNVENRSYSTMA